MRPEARGARKARPAPDPAPPPTPPQPATAATTRHQTRPDADPPTSDPFRHIDPPHMNPPRTRTIDREDPPRHGTPAHPSAKSRNIRYFMICDGCEEPPARRNPLAPSRPTPLSPSRTGTNPYRARLPRQPARLQEPAHTSYPYTQIQKCQIFQDFRWDAWNGAAFGCGGTVSVAARQAACPP